MRIKRFAEARPTVPGQVWVLLLVTVATAIGGLAALGHPGVRRRLQRAVLAGTTAVLALTLVTMHDLDRPFDGLVRSSPRRCWTSHGESPPCPPVPRRRARRTAAPSRGSDEFPIVRTVEFPARAAGPAATPSLNHTKTTAKQP